MAELMLGAPLLWTTVLAPVVAGVACLVASGRSAALLAGFSWALVLTSLILLAPLVYSVDAPAVVVDPWYAEVPGLGVFGLMVDGVSLAYAIAIATVSMGVAIYSYRYMEHRFGELGAVPRWGVYFLLYQLFTAGMLGAVYSINTVLFYLFLELTLIPSFLLIVLYGYGERVRIGLLYMVWTHAGAALFLVAVLIIGLATGVFNIYAPGVGYIVAVERQLGEQLAYLTFTLLVLGLGIKMALLGLHVWLPYAHAEAPTPISALLSPLLIGLGAYGLLRIGLAFYPTLWTAASPLLLAWALATMIYGGLMALTQTDIKRFLAYSSVSQMGYLMLGLATGNYAGLSGAVLHYVSHAYGKAALFAAAGVLIVAAHTRDMNEMGGLASRLPYTAAAALTGFLYLTGIPPTLGLLSEYLIARGLAEWGYSEGGVFFTASLAAFMVAVAVSAVYCFVGFRRVFLGRPGPAASRVSAEPSSMAGPTLFLALAGVVLFLFPEPLAGPVRAVVGAIAAAGGGAG